MTKIDVRTADYLLDQYKQIGCLGENGGEELSLKEILKLKKIETTPEKLWEKNLWLNATAVLLKYKNDEGIDRYCAEVWVPYGGDGLYTHTYIFDREPSEENVVMVHLIGTIRCRMSIGDIEPTFTCWECGKESHWLDSEEQTIEKRWQYLKEKYCGC